MGCAFTGDIKQSKMKEDGRRDRLGTLDCRKKSTRVIDNIVERVTIVSNELSEEQILFATKVFEQHNLFCGLAKE
jgi:hypothetical protein